MFELSSFFNSITFKVWVNGPVLNTPRYNQICIKIRKDNNDPSLSIIVVGGYYGAQLTSVEILDENSATWRLGPYLPVGIASSKIVEDPRGGVILIGGNTSTGKSNLLYRLKHGGFNAKWELMAQTLKVPNIAFAAMIIPDILAQNCTYN